MYPNIYEEAMWWNITVPPVGWVNDTWTAFTTGGTEDWSNVTKVINDTAVAAISWKVFANDTSDHWNDSETYSFSAITTTTTSTTTTVSSHGSSGGRSPTTTTVETTTTVKEEEEEEEKPTKEIPKALFDISAELTRELVDEELVAKITLINFGEPGLVNATVHYVIKDSFGNVVYEETEVVPVETQVEYLKTFDISGFKDDEYTLLVDLEYQEQKEPAKSESAFTVDRKVPIETDMLSILLIVLAAIFVISIFYWRRQEIFKTDHPRISLILALSLAAILILCLIFSVFLKGYFIELGTTSPIILTLSVILVAIVAWWRRHEIFKMEKKTSSL